MPSLWSMIPTTSTFDISLLLSKANHSHTNKSSMTCTMVISGVHVDLQSGKPLRAKLSAWKVAAGKCATSLLRPELIEVYVHRYGPTQPQLPFVANRLTGHSCAYAHHPWCWSEPVMSPPSIRAIQRLLQRDKYALCQFISPQKAHKGKSCDCLTRWRGVMEPAPGTKLACTLHGPG